MYAVQENMKASGEDRLPEDQLIGQMSCVSPPRVFIVPYANDLLCRTIIFAAMDTTSNTMARTLQFLAAHLDVQMKLRREIIDMKTGGNHLDYDQLHALPYLDAVCRETLRL